MLTGLSNFKFNFLKRHKKQQCCGDREYLWGKILKAKVLSVQMGERGSSRPSISAAA